MIRALAAVVSTTARLAGDESPAGAAKSATGRTLMGAKKVKVDDIVRVRDPRDERDVHGKVLGGFILRGDTTWRLRLAPLGDERLHRPSYSVNHVVELWRHDTPTVRSKLFGGRK